MEQRTGVAADDTGAYWLARTSALEQVASVAHRLADREPGLCHDLRVALDVLEGVRAPACRNGDHQVAA